eukprot:3103081-Amphidinium_carterae.2
MAKGQYTPKKGRARLLRRPAERKTSRVIKVKGKPACYVRRPASSMSSRHAREMDRVTPTLTWGKLQGMRVRSVWSMLRDMGLVDDGRGQRWSKCIMCGANLAGNRCLARACIMRFHRQTNGRKKSIFVANANAVDLKTQVMIGLNCVLGVQQNHCHMQLGCNHKAVERVYAALRHE